MHQKFKELMGAGRLPQTAESTLERISSRLTAFQDFTPLQKEVFEARSEDFWDPKKHLMICGATSSGKTLIAEIAMLPYGKTEWSEMLSLLFITKR